MFSTFRTTAIGVAVLALAAGFALPAQAAFVLTLQEVGTDVIANGSGILDITDLSSGASVNIAASMSPAIGLIYVGPAGVLTMPLVFTGFTGPTSFGSGAEIDANDGNGDDVGIDGKDNLLFLPGAAGASLADTATWNNQTLASLGVTPGTYEWTWGTGAHADSFTLQILAVPEPASLTLLAVGLAGLGMVVRRRRV
jgi:hypothetical protein